MQVLNPIGQRILKEAECAPRLATLVGASVALLENSKPGGADLLTGVAQGLREAGATLVKLFPKDNAAKPHPRLPLIAGECTAAVVALAD